MKHLKIGIVAIAALAVMSFTVASHSGVFKKPNANTCYASIRAKNPANGVQTINRGDAGCPPFSFNCAIKGVIVDPATCAGGSHFCCVNLAPPKCTVITPNDGFTAGTIFCQPTS